MRNFVCVVVSNTSLQQALRQGIHKSDHHTWHLNNADYFINTLMHCSPAKPPRNKAQPPMNINAEFFLDLMRHGNNDWELFIVLDGLNEHLKIMTYSCCSDRGLVCCGCDGVRELSVPTRLCVCLSTKGPRCMCGCCCWFCFEIPSLCKRA